ncbi:hypothetical protein BDV96DRAFT_178878 [Lophiotrema nucula]|uniref:Uncharacterized protein n=1 Tax=Lophiotrema nucula TaxID=690887 RepID=A0A6A5YXI5_9PLEO|nr:hypothetical protein BDV96DRAFT_178878 [Lophiotrema nucula]
MLPDYSVRRHRSQRGRGTENGGTVVGTVEKVKARARFSLHMRKRISNARSLRRISRVSRVERKGVGERRRPQEKILAKPSWVKRRHCQARLGSRSFFVYKEGAPSPLPLSLWPPRTLHDPTFSTQPQPFTLYTRVTARSLQRLRFQSKGVFATRLRPSLICARASATGAASRSVANLNLRRQRLAGIVFGPAHPLPLHSSRYRLIIATGDRWHTLAAFVRDTFGCYSPTIRLARSPSPCAVPLEPKL